MNNLDFKLSVGRNVCLASKGLDERVRIPWDCISSGLDADILVPELEEHSRVQGVSKNPIVHEFIIQFPLPDIKPCHFGDVMSTGKLLSLNVYFQIEWKTNIIAQNMQ
jgi:hypothetical protein